MSFPPAAPPLPPLAPSSALLQCCQPYSIAFQCAAVTQLVSASAVSTPTASTAYSASGTGASPGPGTGASGTGPSTGGSGGGGVAEGVAEEFAAALKFKKAQVATHLNVTRGIL